MYGYLYNRCFVYPHIGLYDTTNTIHKYVHIKKHYMYMIQCGFFQVLFCVRIHVCFDTACAYPCMDIHVHVYMTAQYPTHVTGPGKSDLIVHKTILQ